MKLSFDIYPNVEILHPPPTKKETVLMNMTYPSPIECSGEVVSRPQG